MSVTCSQPRPSAIATVSWRKPRYSSAACSGESGGESRVLVWPGIGTLPTMTSARFTASGAARWPTAGDASAAVPLLGGEPGRGSSPPLALVAEIGEQAGDEDGQVE